MVSLWVSQLDFLDRTMNPAVLTIKIHIVNYIVLMYLTQAGPWQQGSRVTSRRLVELRLAMVFCFIMMTGVEEVLLCNLLGLLEAVDCTAVDT